VALGIRFRGPLSLEKERKVRGGNSTRGKAGCNKPAFTCRCSERETTIVTIMDY